MRKIGVLLGLILWICAPIAAAVGITGASSAASVAGPIENVWAPVREAVGSHSEPVDLVLSWADGPKIAAPAWSGIVQEVAASPGSMLSDGAAVARIDGVLRIAVLSPQPFYRPLTTGDSGPDVGWLNDLLVRRGESTTAGQVFTSATARGVKQLARSLNSAELTSFDPAWVVWLPTPTYSVTKVSIQAGFPAPSPGTAIFEAKPYLARAILVANGVLDTSSNPAGSDAPTVSANQILTVPASSYVAIGSQKIELTAERNAIAQSGLDMLASLAGATQSVVQATISQPVNAGEYLVPTATIIGSDNGTCVRLRKNSGGSVPVEVKVVADLDGQTLIFGKLSLGQRVLVAPTGQDRECS
jgi:hypothetical protein